MWGRDRGCGKGIEGVVSEEEIEGVVCEEERVW